MTGLRTADFSFLLGCSVATDLPNRATNEPKSWPFSLSKSQMRPDCAFTALRILRWRGVTRDSEAEEGVEGRKGAKVELKA